MINPQHMRRRVTVFTLCVRCKLGTVLLYKGGKRREKGGKRRKLKEEEEREEKGEEKKEKEGNLKSKNVYRDKKQRHLVQKELSVRKIHIV